MDDRKIRNYAVGRSGKVRREWLTPTQRDYAKVLLAALNSALAVLIFWKVWG